MIYINLLLKEKDIKYKPCFGYMDIQNEINKQMRAILIDWLIYIHLQFKFKSEILFQTVWIIDAYLSNKPITRYKFQLLGVASLIISCKFHERKLTEYHLFVDISDGVIIKMS